MLFRSGVAQILRGVATRPSTFSEDDLEAYRRVWLQPSALTAALAYYRSILGRGRRWLRRRARRIDSPTLVLWGMCDRALSPRLLDGLGPWVPNLKIRRFPAVGHWVQHDAADEVNQELVQFLRGDQR